MDGEHANPAPRGAGNSRRGDVERRILDSTVALIHEGLTWHQVGIRQITERADLSRTAFYDFFATKTDVLVQIISARHAELSEAVRRPGAAITAELSQPEPFLVMLAEYNRAHGHVYRAFLQAMAEDDELIQLWRSMLGRYVALIASAIERERAVRGLAGRMPPANELAEVLVLATERNMMAMLRGPEAETEPGRLQALAHVWRAAVISATGD